MVMRVNKTYCQFVFLESSSNSLRQVETRNTENKRKIGTRSDLFKRGFPTFS